MNKRKVLDAARKHAQKGAKQKALKEYERLLAVDPRDAKLLLEVGDAYRRWGQVEEAIAQYDRVAGQFRNDGFDARAVAVYKQILNLDPKRYATYVSLGDLYQHMGLDSEAIGSLQTAADGFHKDGDKPKALELLRKMAALDPSNTTSRMKVADLLKQEGMNEDAVLEYREVAVELKRQSEHENVPVVLQRILEITPESVETLASLADCYMELSRADRAEPFAVKLAEIEADADAFERLCTVYRSLGDDEKLVGSTRALAKLYRDRGDEDQAREIMQRLPTEAVVETGGLGSDQSELEEPVLSDDELLQDDEFLLGDEYADDDDDVELALETPSADQPIAPDETAPEVSDEDSSAALDIAEGDPDQLFAEATVYLRYGKLDQAVASLKGIIVQEPEHRGALEKLGEAMIEKGDEAAALASWQRAAELAAQAGDASALDLLRDRVMTLDPATASELPVLDKTPDAEPTPDLDEDEFEIDLDLDVETEDSESDEVSGETTGALELDLGEGGEGLETAIDEAAPGAEDQSDDEGGFEIDLDAEDLGLEDDLEPAGADAENSPVASTGDDEVGVDVEFDVEEDGAGFDLTSDELELGEDAAETEPASAVSLSANENSTTTAARIKEELEEAEFYLQQDLDSEAEAIYRRILEIAPGHPSALLRLGELAARKGQDPADVSDRDAAASTVAGADLDQAALEIGLDEDSLDVEDSLDLDVDVEVSTQDEASHDAVAVDTGESEFVGAFAEENEGETEDSTEVAMLDAETMDSPEPPSSNPLLSEEMAEAAIADTAMESDIGVGLDMDIDAGDGLAADEIQADETPEPIAAATDDDSFDLAAELAGAFEDANASSGSAEVDEAGEVLSKVEDGFESIFSDFKKGVSAALEDGDYETRYDLGIAYREMGLYQDAIAEFRVCLDSPNRKLESLHLMGLSAYDLGRFGDAINHLEQALSTPDLEEARKIGIYFDLGRAHEASGDLARAEGVYCEVESLDASFPGIAEHLESVRSGGAGAPLEVASVATGELESFGDLFSDDEDEEVGVVEEGEEEEEAGPEESFENFDDFITDVEAEIGGGLAESLLETEPEPEPDEEPPVDPGTSGRRKKKISFV